MRDSGEGVECGQETLGNMIGFVPEHGVAGKGVQSEQAADEADVRLEDGHLGRLKIQTKISHQE